VPRLLLVDDDLKQLALRKLLLEAAGYEVLAAANTPEATRLLEQTPPELLLMDLRLPELQDGIDLIRCASLQRPAVRVIVLSGWSEDLYDLPEEKLVSLVLDKPIRQERLIEAINSVTSWPARNLPAASS
jgi:CheY-like chemotaxis protein